MPEPMDDARWNEVMERLTRIRALADRAGTLAEAEAATAALSRLLLRYNLSMTDLDDLQGDTRGGVETEVFEVANSAGWRHYLLHALAQSHFCRAVRYPGTRRAVLIGHPHNITVVKDLHRWLSVVIDRLAASTWEEERDREAARLLLDDESPYHRFAEARAALPGKAGRRGWTSAFRAGAVDGIWRRLLDEREMLKEETSEEAWAVVPLLDAEVQAFMDEAFGNVGSYQISAGNPVGYQAGRDAGYAINIGARELEG